MHHRCALSLIPTVLGAPLQRSTTNPTHHNRTPPILSHEQDAGSSGAAALHGFLAFEGWRQLFVWRGIGADALVTAAREPPPQDVTDQGKVLALWKRAGALAVGIDPSNDVLAIEFIGNGWTDLRSLVQDVYVVQRQVTCLSTETELLRQQMWHHSLPLLSPLLTLTR
jgi:hypothetical protein